MHPRRALFVILGLMAALLFAPGAAAQGEPDGDDFLLHVNGTTTIAADRVTDDVIAINGDAVVDGTIRDTLWVVSGNGTVNGRVDGDILVFDGTLNLGPNATVKDVTLVRGTLNQEQGATITGELSERSEFVNFGWGSGVFSFLFWLGTTMLVLLAGLAFAALGGRQLTGASTLLTARFGESILAALVLWIGLPILGVVALFTVVGIPLGLTVLFFVLPALWFLGYIVAGARLGAWLVRRFGLQDAPERPYLAAVIGLFVCQVITLVPIVGGLLVGIAGFLGAGVLGLLAYRGWRGRERSAVRTVAAPAT